MRILTEIEMMTVSGGGGLDSPGKSDAGYGRNTDFGASRGPQTRGGRRNDGRNAAMDSYLGKDVYGANTVGLNRGVLGAVAGALFSGGPTPGGIARGIAGAIVGGAISGDFSGGLTSPSPSNRGGNSSGRGGVGDSRGDGGSRGGGQ